MEQTEVIITVTINKETVEHHGFYILYSDIDDAIANIDYRTKELGLEFGLDFIRAAVENNGMTIDTMYRMAENDYRPAKTRISFNN